MGAGSVCSSSVVAYISLRLHVDSSTASRMPFEVFTKERAFSCSDFVSTAWSRTSMGAVW